MSHRLRDSFDFYGALTDAVGPWTSLGTASFSTRSRFGVGQSVSNGTTLNQLGLQATWANTSNTVFVQFAHTQVEAPTASPSEELRFYDGATVQFAIRFVENGDIAFYRGTTLLGTYSGAFSGNEVWNHFQFKIIIDGTNGEIHVRKNGSNVDNYSLTGQNTQNSANARTTGMDCICRSSATSRQYFDDFWVFDNTNAADGAPYDWIGDVRAVPVLPRTDFITNLTPVSGTTYQSQGDTLGTQALASNVQRAMYKFVAANSGTVASLNVNLNAASANSVKFGIFDATGGSGGPGSLITNGTANVLAAPAIGINNVAFGTPPSIVRGTSYWVVALANGAMTLKGTVINNQSSFTQSQTYATGLASPMALTAVSQAYGAIELVVTPTAASNANHENAPTNDPSNYNSSAVVNDYDLYSSSDFSSYTPSQIFGVTVRVLGYKSDAGARSGKARLRSNVTVVDGTALALPVTTPTEMFLDQFTDPDTTNQWSTSGVTNCYFGPLVSA